MRTVALAQQLELVKIAMLFVLISVETAYAAMLNRPRLIVDVSLPDRAMQVTNSWSLLAFESFNRRGR